MSKLSFGNVERPLWRKGLSWARRQTWDSRLGRIARLPFVIIFNHLVIMMGLDGAYVRWRHEWKARPYYANKSAQENVGFSHLETVEHALRRVHYKLREVAELRVPTGSRVLDVGSGTGLVARQLIDRWQVVGVDISPSLTEAARTIVPDAEFYVGDICDTDVGGPFAMAYSIGVIQYIPPGQLRRFFTRVASLLCDNGIIFVQYPHPVNRLQLWYPNLLETYYRPKVMERAASEFFDTVEHHHCFRFEKKVIDLDPAPYSGNLFVNGYLYIGTKRAPS